MTDVRRVCAVALFVVCVSAMGYSKTLVLLSAKYVGRWDVTLKDSGGKSYPNTDLYIGDFSKSGMKAASGNCSGPAGNGQELTNVYTGNPGSAVTTSIL